MSGVTEGDVAGAELPEGWAWATLAEIAAWGSGGTPKARNSAFYGGSIPWAVIGDLTDGYVRETASSITEEGLSYSSAKLVPSDSVLVAMYGSIGKLGINAHPLTTNQAIAFAVSDKRIVTTRYLFWYLRSQRGALIRAGKGGTQQNISQSVLKEWPIPVPPLKEQHRIVEALEVHLSHLDTAETTVKASHERTAALRRSLLNELVPQEPPPSWKMTTVGEAGIVELGRQRHPDWHTGPEMHPYLRVANVFEDRIDVSDVKEMDFSGVFNRYKLHSGDILLNEGQSPHLVGRPAMYRGFPENVAFTNSLLRFRAREDVLPEWALLVFRRHLHTRRFMQEVRITTNIAHLSAKRLKSVEFPIPPLEEQRLLVSICRDRLEVTDTFDTEISKVRVRSQHLRRALLQHAFTGRLVPQDPADEPASVLLARIQEERAAQAKVKPKRARRAPAKRAVTAAGPPPAASSVPLPSQAVQPTFDVFQDEPENKPQDADQ